MASGGADIIETVDECLLRTLNELRLFETRPQLDHLPKEVEELSHPRKLAFITRCVNEIQFHSRNQTTKKLLQLPYKNQIFLNDTEHKLRAFNYHQSNLQQPSVTLVHPAFIAESDKGFYLPPGTDLENLIFITDSDTRLIHTPTYVVSFKSYQATHQLHISAQPLTSTPKIKISKVDTNTSPKKKQSFNLEGLHLEGLLDQFQSAENKSESKVESISSDPATPSDPGSEPESESKMDDALALRIATLEKEKEAMADNLRKIQLKPRSVKTEREEIGDLKAQMNDMMNMMKIMQVGQTLNATNETERLVVDKFRSPTVEDAPPLLFQNLERPKNIIAMETARDPPNLAILKPAVINSTIGIYDPDNQPDADFRGIWERVLDHTRNHELYEHEYLTCLRMIMKGSAATALDKMNKEYKGDINSILEAIHDLFIPQHTLYDELDELNHFKRKPKEHMRTMVRRASLLIYKLKDTVAPAAWHDRRHTLLSQIIKQVIDKKTFRHLRSEELKCAQLGTSLTIEAMTNIIEFYETSYDLIPQAEIKLTYNVNTMRLTNQPDIHQSEMNELKDTVTSLQASIKSLAPKRPRLPEKPIPSHKGMREILRGKRRLNNRMDSGPSQSIHQTPPQPMYNQHREVKRETGNMFTPQTAPQLTQAHQKPHDQRRSQYKGNPNHYKPPLTYSGPTRSNSHMAAQYKPNPSWNKHYTPPRSHSPHYRNNFKGNTRGKNKYEQKSYQFKGKNHEVNLHFYKCAICPDAHPEGSGCTSIKAVAFSPNE